MDKFKLTLDEKIAIIAYEAKNFIVKVEKDRKLTDKDTGAILETTLYKEQTTFVPECCFVFEVIDSANNPIFGLVDTKLLYASVNFFFHSILNTTYFVKSIPKFSALYQEPITTLENVNEIQVSDLYNLLSGY